jgi:hypothetical protein
MMVNAVKIHHGHDFECTEIIVTQDVLQDEIS